MIGDLALAGCDWSGRFLAYRSGHRLNAELVRAIAGRRNSAERTVEDVAPKQMQPETHRKSTKEPRDGHPHCGTCLRSIPGPKSTTRSRSARSASSAQVRIGRGTRLENSVTLMGHVTIG